ncbi:hypothetical protein ACQ4PT_029663 [Festuca glaucescens]
MTGSLHSSFATDNNSRSNATNNSSCEGEAALHGGVGHALAAAMPSTRDLVLACADLMQCGDLAAARCTAEIVLFAAFPRGNATDRLADHFARALVLCVDAKAGLPFSPRSPAGAAPAPSGAYLTFNQTASFLQFAHLTANQAILEAVDGARRIHMLDLDVAHGMLWPPLLQAITENADPVLGSPEVRITGAGADRDTLLRTGNHLRAFAYYINLPFHFTPLLLSSASSTHHVAGTSTTSSVVVTSLELHPNETLVMNYVLFLHKLGGQDDLVAFLKWVKAMTPTMVTVFEMDASGGGIHPMYELLHRVESRWPGPKRWAQPCVHVGPDSGAATASM